MDSERILTQLRTEGYKILPHYQDAGAVTVNTYGVIDAAKEESLEAIGDAIQENGRVSDSCSSSRRIPVPMAWIWSIRLTSGRADRLKATSRHWLQLSPRWVFGSVFTTYTPTLTLTRSFP